MDDELGAAARLVELGIAGELTLVVGQQVANAGGPGVEVEQALLGDGAHRVSPGRGLDQVAARSQPTVADSLRFVTLTSSFQHAPGRMWAG